MYVNTYIYVCACGAVMSVTIFQAMDFARMAADGTMRTLVPRRTATNLRVLVDKCAAVLDG
jgi:hypothetical protein